MRPFQKPDPDAVRANARASYDSIAQPILLLNEISTKQNEQYRAMFVEGYLHGFAKGGVFALAQLLPEAPDSPASLLTPDSGLPPAPTSPEDF
jgi:hypothetical protein